MAQVERDGGRTGGCTNGRCPGEIAACMPWLRMEIALGIREADARRRAFDRFVADLTLAHSALRTNPP